MTRDTERTRARSRRVPGRHLAAAGLSVLALVATSAPAHAVTRKEMEAARRKYQQVQADLNRIAQEYAKQEERADNLAIQIKQTSREIDKADAESAQLQQQLKARVRTAYRLGGLGFFEFLLSSNSFRDFSLRAVMLERQASHDEDLMLKLRKLRAQKQSKQSVLKQRKKEQTDAMSSLRKQAARLDETFGSAKALLSRLEDQQRAEELARMRTRKAVQGGGSGRVVGMVRCPAAGPHAFSNDWGAPRGGGKRRHKGNDVFGPMGSPAVAVVSGSISRHGSGGNAGLSIYLWGDDGVEYFYAHMSGFATSVGARVSAGQLIGYIGNSGNARGGAPHIHFEVHPGGGAPINPYYSLIRVC